MWLAEYRDQYGLTLNELGGMIRRAGRRKTPRLWLSDELLYNLETDPKFRTVPKLADLIAEACGATAKQRDELVLEQHRGTWKPTRATPEIERKRGKAESALDAERKLPGERPVVKLSRSGEEAGRYRSVVVAAMHNGMTEQRVGNRCRRSMRKDEFKVLGFTFRFADEWDRMTDAERREDLFRLQGARGRQGGDHYKYGVVLVNRAGSVIRHKSMRDAAAVVGLRYATFAHRLERTKDRSMDRCYAWVNGYKVLYAHVWDALPEASQARIREQDDR